VSSVLAGARGQRNPGGRGSAGAEVGIVGRGEDAGGPAVLIGHGEGIVWQSQLTGTFEGQSEQGGQVGLQCNVVRNLSSVSPE
jgi:hypothetical protein